MLRFIHISFIEETDCNWKNLPQNISIIKLNWYSNQFKDCVLIFSMWKGVGQKKKLSYYNTGFFYFMQKC